MVSPVPRPSGRVRSRLTLSLGLNLSRDLERSLRERCQQALGLELRFLRGDPARALMAQVPETGGTPAPPLVPPSWHLVAGPRQQYSAYFSLPMPPGEPLLAQVGPFYLDPLQVPPGSEEAPILRDSLRGELLLVQELLLARLEQRGLELRLERQARREEAARDRESRDHALESLCRLAMDSAGVAGVGLVELVEGKYRILHRAGSYSPDPEGLGIRTRRHVPISEILESGESRLLEAWEGHPACLLVPVSERSCLIACAHPEEVLGEDERRHVERVGEQLQFLLATTEVEQRSQHRISYLETMNMIEERIHGTLDLVDVVETALDLCAHHLGGTAQSLLLHGDGSRDLHLRDRTGACRVLRRPHLEEEETALASILEASRPLRIQPDATRGVRIGYYPAGSRELLGCMLGSPQRPLGVLLVALDRVARSQDMELLRLISMPVGRALKNAVLFEKGERQIAELSLINEMGKALNSSLDLDDVLHYIVDMIASILEADRGSLMLLDREANELYIEVATGLSERGRRLRLPVGQGIAGYVAASQSPVLSVNTATDKRYQVEVRGNLHPLTLISAPITCRGKLLGVLNFERPLDKKASFDLDDLELLATLASQAGIAIENAGLYNDLVQVYFDTIRSLAAALEAKDIYTHGHSRRVAKDAVRIGRRLGMSRKELEMLRHGALLHDIGKIGIRDTILFKVGPLETEERRHIQAHPTIGANILSNFEVLAPVRGIIRHHHERWDGGGFPEGLAGEAIPLGARIVCITDSFDAMITSRPYREGMPVSRAMEILEEEKGKQFDPELVDVFLEVIRSVHPALELAGDRSEESPEASGPGAQSIQPG